MVSPLLLLLVVVFLVSEVASLVTATPSPFLFLTPGVLESPEYVSAEIAPFTGSVLGTVLLGDLSLPLVDDPTEPFLLDP